MNNNTATSLLRVAALAGGAVLGALLARWVDDMLSTRVQEQAEYDKARYAQGLTPVSFQPSTDEPRIIIVRSIDEDDPYHDSE